MLPGDIVATGPPRASPLADGDMLECRIERFEALKNPVKDLKVAWIARSVNKKVHMP